MVASPPCTRGSAACIRARCLPPPLAAHAGGGVCPQPDRALEARIVRLGLHERCMAAGVATAHNPSAVDGADLLDRRVPLSHHADAL